MQKITIYLALLLLLVSAGLSAQQPEVMNVHKISGSVQSVSLVNIQRITFEKDVMVFTTLAGTFRLPLNDVNYIAFGEGPTTAVENVEANTTRISLSGNQLMVESDYAIRALYLVDMTGKVLVSQQLSSSTEATISLSQSGAFVLFLETTQGYVARKIVNN
jgi:hypothetical protein